MNAESSPPITLETRCQDCGRRETIRFIRGRDLRLPIGWDIWGDDVRCGECAAKGRAVGVATKPACRPALYVAKDLDSWAPVDSGHFASTITVEGKDFRKLDPEYFVWLASRLERARQAADERSLTFAAILELETRWLRVRAWAEVAWGEAEVGRSEAQGVAIGSRTA